jgi:large subunit ribosomal protein L18
VSVARKIESGRKRRTLRVRSRITGTLPRVSVFRSLRHVQVQVIDDQTHKTLASCSSQELTKVTGDKKTVAHALGKEVAKRALAAGVSAAVFDRGGFLFHGRVKAVADGLREGGLTI